MSNKSIRIRTTPVPDGVQSLDSQNIQIKLEQDFDFLEILSLKISQEDLYRSFCADYGVIVGRVIANRGFGVPNAKVSVFIPISSEDERNDLIRDLYPFSTTTTKNNENYRYNLLLSKSTCSLNKPVGTFPTKQEVLDSDIILEIYEKYYKYTTRTNEAGDYMLFGVPTGQQTLHIDVDVSDVGSLSLRPYEMIAEGYPENLFESKVEFKTSTDLDSLAQIKSQDKGVNVIPFWGDTEQCEIGITRVDFDTNFDFKPQAVFMGSILTDVGRNALSRRCNPVNDMGDQCELRTGAGKIEVLRLIEDVNGNPASIEQVNLGGGNLVDEDGVFAFTVPMYTDKVVTDEFGNLVPSNDPEKGVPTKGRYRFKINFNEPPQKLKRKTGSMIFPSLSRKWGGTEGTEQMRWTTDINQYSDTNSTNLNSGNNDDQGSPKPKTLTSDLDLDFHTFEWKQIYTISQFIKKYKKGGNRFSFIGFKGCDECPNFNLLPFTTAIRKANILFSISSFFIDILSFLLRFLIILSNMRFCFYLRLRVAGIYIFKCTRILDLRPFGFIENLLTLAFPEGLNLPCGDETYNVGFDCNLDSCACTNNCPGGSGPCVPQVGSEGGDPCCPKTNGTCDTSNTCLSFIIQTPNESTCNQLNTLQQWQCCTKFELAKQFKAIRFTFFDAWITGTAYLFQFYHKRKVKNNGKIKDKFCGPASDNVGGDNYAQDPLTGSKGSKRCHDGGCLVVGPSIEAPENPDGTTNPFADRNYVGGTSNIDVSLESPGIPNGANDVNEFLYCNTTFPTKIVNLGRVEMCEDVYHDIQRCIWVNDQFMAGNSVVDCNISDFTNGPRENRYDSGINPNSTLLQVGTGGDSGFDRLQVTDYLNMSSHQDPRLVVTYLLTQTNCNINQLFNGNNTIEPCHEKELKTNNYQFVKEISKLHNDIVSIPLDPNDPDSPEQLDILGLANTPQYGDSSEDPGPFSVDLDLREKYHPVNPDSSDINTWDNNPSSQVKTNSAYFYFGLHPGRTALDKLRKEFFTNSQ